MREPTTREVWRAVLGELQLQLPRPTFDTWLKQTEGISCDGRSFVVEVPTPFAVAWLERRMYQSIQKTVEKDHSSTLGRPVPSEERGHSSGGNGLSVRPDERFNGKR